MFLLDCSFFALQSISLNANESNLRPLMQCNAVCLYEAGQCIGLWCCRRRRLRNLLRCGGGGGWGVEGGGGGVCYEDSPNCAALLSATRCPRVLLSPPASSKQLTPVMSTLCFLCTDQNLLRFSLSLFKTDILVLFSVCLTSVLPTRCLFFASENPLGIFHFYFWTLTLTRLVPTNWQLPCQRFAFLHLFKP